MHLAVNPRAGSGRALRHAESAKRAIAGLGIEARIVVPADSAALEVLATDPALGERDVLVGVGGDGTLHHLAQGALARGAGGPVLGVLPAGTGNALALDLGVRGLRDLLAGLESGREQGIDVARLVLDGEPRYCVHVLGWEAAARIGRRANALRYFGPLRYLASTLVEIARSRPAQRVALHDEDQPALIGVASMTRTLGGGIRVAPEARLDDGVAQLVLMRDRGRARLVCLLIRALGGWHLSSPGVLARQVTELELELPAGDTVNVDGEDLPARSVRLRMLPGALRMLAC